MAEQRQCPHCKQAPLEQRDAPGSGTTWHCPRCNWEGTFDTTAE